MRSDPQPSAPASRLGGYVSKTEDEDASAPEVSFSKITLRFPEDLEAEYRNSLGEQDHQVGSPTYRWGGMVLDWERNGKGGGPKPKQNL
jgi:hypothetical protein